MFIFLQAQIGNELHASALKLKVGAIVLAIGH